MKLTCKILPKVLFNYFKFTILLLKNPIQTWSFSNPGLGCKLSNHSSFPFPNLMPFLELYTISDVTLNSNISRLNLSTSSSSMHTPLKFLCLVTLSLLTFLCQVMYSSLSMARRKLGSLYWGCTRHRADATMDAVRGPVTPVIVRNSAMLGVRRKGTGRLASRSPVKRIQHDDYWYYFPDLLQKRNLGNITLG